MCNYSEATWNITMDEVTGDRSCLPTYDRNGLITSSNRKSSVVARKLNSWKHISHILS